MPQQDPETPADNPFRTPQSESTPAPESRGATWPRVVVLVLLGIPSSLFAFFGGCTGTVLVTFDLLGDGFAIVLGLIVGLAAALFVFYWFFMFNTKA